MLIQDIQDLLKVVLLGLYAQASSSTGDYRDIHYGALKHPKIQIYIYIYIYTQVPPITRKCEYVLWRPQAPNAMYIDIFIMCFDMHAETPGP